MTPSLRILILEDNPTDAELVQFELAEAGLVFTAKVVMSRGDFIRDLHEYQPDLILSDYDLPMYNGALALAAAKTACPDTPFILVSGAISEDRAIEILTQGAKDYVLKNRLRQRLVPAVRRALAEEEEQKARRQAEAELREAHRTLEERVRIRTAELEAEIRTRGKMGEALRKSEEKYRIVADFTHDWEFWLGRDGHFRYISPSVERVTGYSISDFAEDPDLSFPVNTTDYRTFLDMGGRGS